jgi:hypothetical protein
MEKDDSVSLNHLKEMIQIFVKNTKLDLYEGFEDFWQDHEALTVIENKIYKTLADDDEKSCQSFYNLNEIHKRIMKNIKLIEKNGEEKIHLNLEIKFKEVATK